ncbi:MAG: YpzG family protein [Bacillaceae bacterium]
MSRKHFQTDPNDKLFHSNWTSAKHFKSTVNGQTQPTQSLIVLHNETKKRQF